MKKINIIIGDITTVIADAIVNAANSSLLGGGGVDGAIHKAGGDKILKECKIIREMQYPNGLPVGEAVSTVAGNLKAKYVIHTVAPQYHYDDKREIKLKSCYTKSLRLADKLKCKSIAFPALGAGAYSYPIEEASKIAYSVKEILEQCEYVEDIIFVFFSEKDAETMKKLIL